MAHGTIRRTRADLKLFVVIVGTSAEKTLGERVAAENRARVINLAGQTDVGTLAALIEGCKVLVANDSGPYHLGVALNIPTVLLFGPGFHCKWARDRANQRVLRHEVGCRCFPWHPQARCKFDRACMKAISVEEVWQGVKELVS